MKNTIEIEQRWEKEFINYFSLSKTDDASHDLGHFRRVYHIAKQIAFHENIPIDMLTILASAYFHDVISLPKNHSESKMSSRYAAVKTREILTQMNFPNDKFDAISHAIEAHSFSAEIEPQTIEAKIIQDADRMEALGALGAMRTFYVTGRMGIELFDPSDLYAERRPLDDKRFGLDHFFIKLFKLPMLLKTDGGRALALQRVKFLQEFIKELELNVKQNNGGALLVALECCEAGKQGRRLFDSLDPFSTHRPLNPDSFVLDRLLHDQKQFLKFISEFLLQLKNEIHF